MSADANQAARANAGPETTGVSVVIATYNGAARVPKVLAALAAQTAPDGFFEVIVVDNNSVDGTAAIVAADPAAAALRARGIALRVVPEPRQGLTHARIRGVCEAHRRLICFLDDDNLPEQDFVEAGVETFADPAISLAVSHVRPSWASEPPPGVRHRRSLLAVNDYLGEERKRFDANALIAPTIGAGLWLRRAAFLNSIPWESPERLLPDRTEGMLVSGGDIEIGVLVGRAGYGRVYEPRLRVVHEIPAARLETRYMRRLIEGIVRSELTLKEKYLGERAGIRIRMIALAQLAAAPLVALWRGDARREMAFIAAAAIARLKGPFRSPR